MVIGEVKSGAVRKRVEWSDGGKEERWREGSGES